MDQMQQPTGIRNTDTAEQSPRYLGEPPNTIASPYQGRSITIRPLSYGYTVEVGCQTFAIETASQLIAKLSEYILNPQETETKWNNRTLFK